MPKILRILNRLIIGGPAINATYLSKYLSPEYETMLVIGGKDDHEKEASHLTEELNLHPVEIPEMKRSIDPKNDRIAYKKLKKIIADFKPDIVHTHAAKSGVIGRLAANNANVPVVVHTFHGHVFHSYFNKFKTRAFIHIERQMAQRSTGIIAISHQQRQELSEVYKICPKEKIQVIPLGLNLDKMADDANKKRRLFRDTYFIKEDEVAIGIIGRIVPIKNHSLFVHAFKHLVENTEKKVRAIIIGDGDARIDMENELKKLDLSYTYFPEAPVDAQVICTSWRTDVDVVLAGLDIVALSSHNEGTPLSLIEAQAAGKPVVSTDVGGVKDVVLHEKTGFIVPADDQIAFGQALKYLAENQHLCSQFGQAGKAHAFKNFSYQRLVSDMDGYYKSQLAKRGK